MLSTFFPLHGHEELSQTLGLLSAPSSTGMPLAAGLEGSDLPEGQQHRALSFCSLGTVRKMSFIREGAPHVFNTGRESQEQTHKAMACVFFSPN